MAKTPTKKAGKGFEETLWDTANQLRGSVESSEYKHVVLSLVFLKFISDKFEAKRKQLIAAGQEAFVEMDVFYQQDNVFFLPGDGLAGDALALLAGFVGLLALDWAFAWAGLAPAWWMRLRIGLTAVVAACLLPVVLG